MGKPLFKAPDGGRLEILWVTDSIAKNELRHGSGTKVFIQLNARPEAFSAGLPMSVYATMR